MINKTNDQTIHHGTVENGAMHPHAGKNLLAIFAYLGVLIIIPFLVDAKDAFIRFHINQGLALIIFDVAGWIVGFFIGWIPVVGGLITSLWAIVSIILVIVGIINVLQGKEKELPLIGRYGRILNF